MLFDAKVQKKIIKRKAASLKMRVIIYITWKYIPRNINIF